MISPAVDPDRLRRAYAVARDALLAERTRQGCWVGELSTSALSTAVAVSALSLVQKAGCGNFDSLIAGGLRWLAEHQNPEGGWGDTVKSLSNISTTMLCRAAFHLSGAAARFEEPLRRSEAWLARDYGRTPEELAEAVRKRYGKDRTFSVPILMTSALAGLVSWKEVPALPFELACFPQSWFGFLQLPVVSYALPALIAIGQAVYHHRPPWNPLARIIRRLVVGKSLRVLTAIQPSNGGFLEATPLTSFVALALASTGKSDHPVVRKCVEFIVSSVRADGSWPIDTNLSTWVTTLAVNALATAGDLDALSDKEQLLAWLLAQQYRRRHPYTGADPGAWAWTPLPGGVPDADDTPGALLALYHLTAEKASVVDDFVRDTVATARLDALEEWWMQTLFDDDQESSSGMATMLGLSWLLRLQNRDGGWPTFCRGWGKLPFDRSGADLTAHALRAVHAWESRLLGARVVSGMQELLNLDVKVDGVRVSFPSISQTVQARTRGLAYLAREQRADGSWLPLWFGNQYTPDDVNPTYGTAKVLAAYRDLDLLATEPAQRGLSWLTANQNDDGGWGGCKGAPSSLEETALAVEVLFDGGPAREESARRGLAWLVESIEAGGLYEPSPIGFYFAKLWYFERLYPIIFAVAALGKACRVTPRACRDSTG